MNDHATKMISDYVSNIDNKEIKTLSFKEEFIAINPIKSDKVDAVYYLYEVSFTDESKDNYILMISETSQMVFKATDEIIKNIFEYK